MTCAVIGDGNHAVIPVLLCLEYVIQKYQTPFLYVAPVMAARDALSSYEGISYVAQLTDTNRSGWLLVCGVITLLYPLCFLALRVWVKYRRFGVDDWMCTGSTVCPPIIPLCILS